MTMMEWMTNGGRARTRFFAVAQNDNGGVDSQNDTIGL